MRNTFILCFIAAIVWGCATTRSIESPGGSDGGQLKYVNPVGSYLKAQVALREGEMADAAVYFQEVIDVQPRHIRARLSLASVLLALDNTTAAAETITHPTIQAVMLPDILFGFYLQSIIRAGDRQQSFEAMQAAQERRLLDPTIFLRWVRHEERRTSLTQLLAYVRALQQGDYDPVIDCALGHLLVRKSAYAEALAPLQRCVNTYAEWVPALLERGLVAEVLGSGEEARLWYRRVLNQQEDQKLAIWRLSVLDSQGPGSVSDELDPYLKQVRLETTLQLAADALRDDDVFTAQQFMLDLDEKARQSNRALLLQGLIAEEQGDYPNAVALFETVMTDVTPGLHRVVALQWVRVLLSQDAAGWLEYAEGYRSEHQSDAVVLAIGTALAETDVGIAIDYLEREITAYEDIAEYHFQLAILYERMGESDLAATIAETAFELDPDHADALNFVGYYLVEQRRLLDRAGQLIRRALELKPHAGYIQDSMGWLLYQQGLPAEAIPWLEKAASNYSDDVVILEHLGDAYRETRQRKLALDAYQRALDGVSQLEDEERLRDKIERLTGER